MCLRSKTFDRIIKKILLKTRIKVLNEMAFINLLTELGYRKDKMWTDDEDEILEKLLNLAEKHTKNILEEFNK